MASAQLLSNMMRSRLIPKHVFVDHQLNNDVDLVELKLPSSLRIQPAAFDPKHYEVEDPIVFTNDKGVTQEKVCAIEDIIRWRYADDNNHQSQQYGKDITIPQLDKKLEIEGSDHRKIESNAKIVQWSDGTYSLAIGDEFFEINMENLTNRQCYSQFEKFLLYKGNVNKKMIVKPPPKSSKNQKRFIKRINEAQQKIQQANITVAGNDQMFDKVRNQRGGTGRISTSYQVERGDENRGNSIATYGTTQANAGTKRTLEQARADLEDDDESQLGGSNNYSKRQRTGTATDLIRRQGGVQGNIGSSNVNDQSNDHAQNEDIESGEEEIYQGRQQIEQQFNPPVKSDSDSDSSDSDSSDSSDAADV